jgi:regulator of protease activity HflC (stomatin/prohibitin superfamily)
MPTNSLILNQEKTVQVHKGSVMLSIVLLYLVFNVAALIVSLTAQHNPIWPLLIVAIIGGPVSIIMMMGFFTLQPNEARVLILFGRYKGTVRESGFHWGNPFYANGSAQGYMPQGDAPQQKTAGFPIRAASSRNKISLRARTLNVEKLKVNDKQGNPIEIGAVVVWRVRDTAQAMFDVDDYERYVQMQSETALRHLATSYAYDNGEENEPTLRSHVENVSTSLRQELEQRLVKAGVAIEETRLTHLAYAPEIAQAMLRRQQAEAVIAARQKIVHGAVSMVDMALRDLADKHVVDLDDERRASMVSNLMVVLCSESEVHPVVNTGTLYN